MPRGLFQIAFYWALDCLENGMYLNPERRNARTPEYLNPERRNT